MSARVPLTFKIFRGNQLLREEMRDQAVIKIGKVPSAHLCIEDESISRMHAILEVGPAGQVQLIDLGSTRGTLVNGHKINKARLESGDRLQFGDIRVELSIGVSVAAGGVRDSAVRDSAVRDSAVRDSAVRDSAVRDSAVRDSAVRDSAVRDSAVRDSAVRDSAVRDSAVRDSAVRDSAVRDSAVRDSAVRDSAVRDSAVRDSAVRDSAVRDSAVAAPAMHTVAAPAMHTVFAAAELDHPGGAQAIEVAAMLGDSVVSVKHCIDPKSGRISSKTWGLLAVGLASLLISAVAFGVSVTNAAFNKGALDYWTHVAHKPAFGYRPQMLGIGYDWLAFGGLALGLVVAGLALARMRDEKTSPYFRIGTAPGVELPLENAPAPSFPLVAPSGDDFVFNYGVGIDGEMIVDGKEIPLAELAASGRARPSTSTAGAIEVPIPPRAKIRARAGMATFIVSAVAQPRRQVVPLMAGLESRTLTYLAGSLAVHLGIWGLLQQIPQDGGATDIDFAALESTTTRSTSTQNEDTPRPPVDDEGDSGDNPGMGKPMELAEGAAGTTHSTRADGHMRMKNNKLDPQVARQLAIEEARNSGILGNAAAMGAAFSSLSSTANMSSGFDATDVNGPIYGAEGEARGMFGYGRTGFGPGAGCSDGNCGLIGTGRYGTYGTGPRAGEGWSGPGGLGGPFGRRHQAQVPTTVIGQPTGTGDLDKAIIRRYIKQNYAKLAYCYEHELLAHPDLSGEVLAQFMISGSGTVQGSTATGFDPTVASCIADVIKHIAFPRPANGGSVAVNYPFSFHQAGR